MTNPLVLRNRGRKSTESQCESSSGNAPMIRRTSRKRPNTRTFAPMDEIPDSDAFEDLPNAEPLREEFLEEESPDANVIDLIGDNTNVSDAAAALKAFLADGDIKASSRITGKQRVACWDLLHVAQTMNCDQLLREVEEFLMLRISEDGTGRQEAIKGFNGLYEPNRNQQNDNSIPSGQLRGSRF